MTDLKITALSLLWTCALALSFASGCSDDSSGQQSETQVLQDTPSLSDADELDALQDSSVSHDLALEDDEQQSSASSIGLPCSEIHDPSCSDGLCATIYPNGYCTALCADQSCPDDASCVLRNEISMCLKNCQSDDDCRKDEGYVCQNGLCDVSCTSNLDCNQDLETCENGHCLPKPPDRDLGMACIASQQCFSQICLGDDWGICSLPCDQCPAQGWHCESTTTVENAQAQDYCVPDPESLTENIVEPNADGKYEIEIAPDTVSFQIVGESNYYDSYYGIFNLVNPDGQTLAGEYSMQTGFTEPIRLTLNSGHGTAIVPNDDHEDHGVSPGTWHFEMASYGYGSLGDVHVFQKHAHGEIAQASFDLNVFIADGAISGLDASTAPTHSTWQAILGKMRDDYWAGVGLSIGEIHYYDMNDSFATIDNSSELHQMFAGQTRNKDGQTINLFLVRSIDVEGGEAAGIAGGIPGPVGINGTGGSGVAVEVQGSIELTAKDMSHEIGHLLGLYHVTEIAQSNQSSLIHDVIIDTPECQEDPYYAAYFMTDPCTSNIMFPILMPEGKAQWFTSAQGRIFRYHPQSK